jgi:hypothetical protein
MGQFPHLYPASIAIGYGVYGLSGARMAVGVWRFFPSSEYIIGGRDPGAYINEGIQIAQRGTLTIHDPVMAAVPTDARDLFFPQNRNPSYDYDANRFMGFFAMDVRRGEVMGQFPHLYPASIAIGYGVYGLSGARMAVGVWAILGLLAVYFAGARLFGRAPAFAAALLLSVHVLQVWFARYPNSEAGLQALLFAALLAFAHAHQDDDRFFAPIAAALATLTIFLRVDGLALSAGLVATALVVWLLTGRRPRAWFVVCAVAGVGLGLLYMLGPMRAYFGTPIAFMGGFSTLRTTLSIAGAVVAILALVAVRRFGLPTGTIPYAVCAVAIGAAIYAWFLRRPVNGELADYDAFALRIFTDFYLTRAALIAALVGLVVAARRLFWHGPAFFGTWLMFGLLFFYKIRVWPEHFWMARRYLPLVLPGALLLIAALAIGRWRDDHESADPHAGAGPMRSLALTRVGVGAILLAVLGWHFAAQAAPVMRHVEYAGVIPALEGIAAKVGDRDLLLVESRDVTGSDIHILGLPLAYIYARNVLVFSSAAPDRARLEAFLDDARQRYARVLFLGGGGTLLLSRRIGALPLDDGRIKIAEYAQTPWNIYPDGVHRKDFDYTLYEITTAEVADGGFSLDVGSRDDLNVVRFYAKETSDGRSIRWTGRQSAVSVTGLTGGEREIAITMHDGGRPPAEPRPVVQVFFNETPIGEVAVGAGFAVYRVPLPPALAAAAAASDEPARLRLTVSSTWNPRKLLGAPDDRELGVMVDRVEVH